MPHHDPFRQKQDLASNHSVIRVNVIEYVTRTRSSASPPRGGPPSHRHDFEESFTILEGEIEATFRGKRSVVRAGETVNIPAKYNDQTTVIFDLTG